MNELFSQISPNLTRIGSVRQARSLHALYYLACRVTLGCSPNLFSCSEIRWNVPASCWDVQAHACSIESEASL